MPELGVDRKVDGKCDLSQIATALADDLLRETARQGLVLTDKKLEIPSGHDGVYIGNVRVTSVYSSSQDQTYLRADGVFAEMKNHA